MELSDLPPELFEAIIHKLVSVTKAEGAWKLRAVCRTFRNTIEHDIFANHAITVFGEHAREQLLRPNMGLYLYHRSKRPLDSHTSLPSKINQMVSVAEELQLIGYQPLDTARQAIYNKLGGQDQASTVIEMLGRGTVGSYHNSLDEALTPKDKFIAAIAVDENELILRLIPEIEPTRWQLFIGWPLLEVITLEQEAPLHALLDVYRHRMEQCKKESLDDLYLIDSIRCSIEQTILKAMSDGRIDLVRFLALWYSEHIEKWPKSNHNKLLEAAIRADRASVVTVLLDVPGRTRRNCPTITTYQCRLLCMFGAINTMKQLIEMGHMEVHIKPKDKVYLRTPLVEAVRTNHLDVAKLLLQAGADIDMLGSYKEEKMTPIEVAISKGNAKAVEWLFFAGASLPKEIKWPKDEATCEVLRRAGL